MQKVFKSFTPMKVSGLLAYIVQATLQGELYVIAWLEISQSEFHIPFWFERLQQAGKTTC